MADKLDLSTEFRGRRALVTGGTQGIGAGIAQRLLDGGAQVVVAGRSRSESTPQKAILVTGDLSVAEGVEAVARQALDAMGGLEILVNNAGGSPIFLDGVTAIPDEEWQNSLALNLMAAVRLTNAVLPALRQSQGGAVLNMSSVSATMAFPFAAQYGAAKAALDYYSRTLAVELGPIGIRVNAISPGPVSTLNADEQRKQFPMSDDDWRRAVPLGSMGMIDDIVEVAALLLSHRGSFLTGVNYVVDGGMTARR
ncbi:MULTISPECIES: oxidoreductase [Sphingobium]|uniref:oxidoreductase n=1 Tax=Sphingobium TaxID=165695 RepID=UPI00159C9447|nr:oxidoreductase [Sphingobium sp. 15-1]